jgi:type VI secretion system protein ImpL
MTTIGHPMHLLRKTLALLFWVGHACVSTAHADDTGTRETDIAQAGAAFAASPLQPAGLCASPAQSICNDRLRNKATAITRALAQRFNRELAGRFPFGAPSAPDADPGTVRAFLRDYAAQRDMLRQLLKELPTANRIAQGRFYDQLDGVSRLWRDALATEATLPILPVQVQFRALAPHTMGGDQIVHWQLSTGAQSASHPNGSTTLHWAVGNPMALDMTWASQSRWQPGTDPAQPDLSVNGKTATFAQTGPWALLRLVEWHRPRALPAMPSHTPPGFWLEFHVPVAPDQTTAQRSEARLYIGLTVDMPPPAAYPGSAP